MALALLLLLSIPGWSNQTYCVDTTATPIDTISADMALSNSGNVVWEIYVERTSSGQTVYKINPASISFTGSCDSVNGMPTSAIFDMLAKATVINGIALGHTSCPSQCTPPTTTTVVMPACVSRTGSGSTTHFTTCSGSGCCTRYYSVCCPNGQGAPIVTLIGSNSTGCSSSSTSCQTTCP